MSTRESHSRENANLHDNEYSTNEDTVISQCMSCGKDTDKCCVLDKLGVRIPICGDMDCQQQVSIGALYNKLNKSERLFVNDMKIVWFAHVEYTFHVITAARDDAKERNGVTSSHTKTFLKRLYENQTDIVKLMTPYIGIEIAGALEAKLKEHITIAVELVGDYLKEGLNSKTANTDWVKWKVNAREIAEILSNVKSKKFTAKFRFKTSPLRVWKMNILERALTIHIQLTDEQIKAVTIDQFGGQEPNWTSAIHAHDKIIEQAQTIANALAVGLINHFKIKPAKTF